MMKTFNSKTEYNKNAFSTHIRNKIVCVDTMLDLANYLSENEEVKIVKFNNITIKPGAIDALVKTIDFSYRNNVKIMFEFNQTKVSENEMKMLSTIFPYFTKIHFRDCHLNDKSIDYIASYLKTNPRNITTIHLEGNHFSAEAHHILYDALSKNTYVDKLFLGYTHDTRSKNDHEDVYRHFSLLLEASKSLRVVGYQESRFKIQWLEHLANAIIKNKSLHSLSLGNKAYAANHHFTKKIANAIRQQGIINQTNDRVFDKSATHAFQSVKHSIRQNRLKAQSFFDSIKNCDIKTVSKLFQNNSYNMFWTTSFEKYNALHLIVLSITDKKSAQSLVTLLYRYGYKQLLHKRSGRESGSLTPIELAKKNKRWDIAKILQNTTGSNVVPLQFNQQDSRTPNHFTFFKKQPCIDVSNEKDFPPLGAVQVK